MPFISRVCPLPGSCRRTMGLECDPKKIEDVKSWPVPDCLKSVRQFLGFVGYYRRFIPKFADIATPLVHFDREGCAVCVGYQLFGCFSGFACFTDRRPDSGFPTETGQYILDTDASNFGLGGVLSQIQDDRSWWWRIVAEHLDLRSDDTALLNARCWRWWPCACSSDPICVEHVLLSGRTTNRWCGCIVLKTRRVCCLDGYILYSNFSSPLYTDRERIMEMLMDFHALHRRRVGSVHGRTAHRPLWYLTTLTNRSTRRPRAARRMQTWYQYSPERTGSLD